ncbi:MAG: 3-deoxy-8-phosphooctulonate synthase [Armatimonadetes bacterium]|nr:3-deoxy-8-phosphooctulonate synthase [Armatimonadota bacterium]
MNKVTIKDFEIGGDTLTVIAGPCLAESKSLCLETAEELKGICSRLGFNYVFKASFDKANRTAYDSPRGSGLADGLSILQEVSEELGVPVTTDIHLPEHAEPAATVADMLQIPAFLCRQTDLLAAAAATGRPVNVKKGQFLSPHDARNLVEKLESFGAAGIMLTERGTTFGYNNLIVDMPGLEIMRSHGWPVCFDATHSAQRPGAYGSVTGGVRDSIPAMVRAAVAVGIDALFIEVHPNPDQALSDAATQWPLDSVEALLTDAARIRAAVSKHSV